MSYYEKNHTQFIEFNHQKPFKNFIFIFCPITRFFSVKELGHVKFDGGVRCLFSVPGCISGIFYVSSSLDLLQEERRRGASSLLIAQFPHHGQRTVGGHRFNEIPLTVCTSLSPQALSDTEMNQFIVN